MDFTLLDTGPLVAFLHRDDQYHAWSQEQLAFLSPPFITCEAVLTEAHYLLRSLPKAQQTMTGMIKDGLIQIAFKIEEEIELVDELPIRYQNVPMSLADACLVRMSELFDDGTVWMIDSGFLIYRKDRKEIIPSIMPPRP